MNILVLMAGKGSRFAADGFQIPKPLIKITEEKTIIEVAMSNINISKEDNLIFMCHSDHKQYDLEKTLLSIHENAKIIYVDSYTRGAACTALIASEYIDTDDELLIMNSDQFIEWNMDHFRQFVHQENADSAIITFIADGSNKWSYVLVDNDGYITTVKEKSPISNIATVGIYYFKRGNDFVSSVNKMIDANDTVNDEFYLAPCYNYLYQDGKSIINYIIPRMYSIGTPEDLYKFKNTQAFSKI
jgi:NDP-sugar pyrophosphorylase family protein